MFELKQVYAVFVDKKLLKMNINTIITFLQIYKKPFTTIKNICNYKIGFNIIVLEQIYFQTFDKKY